MLKRLEETWWREVYQSRIIILPGEASYLAELGLLASTVIERLGDGVLEPELMVQHPGLTQADIRACGLFSYFQAIGRV